MLTTDRRATTLFLNWSGFGRTNNTTPGVGKLLADFFTTIDVCHQVAKSISVQYCSVCLTESAIVGWHRKSEYSLSTLIIFLRPHPQKLNARQVGIRAALEWLMSFFALFEIIKTADLLMDTVVKGLTSLADNIPTEEDVKKMFDSVRSSVGKLT